ncbi:MAG: hypothetical protein QM756_03010 [Polyangiaceae bacterium]
MKLSLVVGSVAFAAGVVACSDAPGTTAGGTGGSTTSAGGQSSNGGSSASTGGSTSNGGASTAMGGAMGGAVTTNGGAVATGGTATNGGSANGGSSTGGASAGGTTNSGGANATGGRANTGGTTSSGGASSGGATSGGAAAGGRANTGGTASTGGAASGGAAVGGAASGGGSNIGGSTCDSSWNPPDTANGNTGLPAGLAKEWARTGPATVKATNTKMHQLMDNGGKMRYCARWDSSSPISAQERQQAAALMRKCDLQWTDKLKGWGCWPYSTVDVKIVMWVVRDASLLTGWTDAEGSYVVGKVSTDEATDVACPAACKQLPGQTQKTSCTGGQVYDEYLWLDGDKTDYTGWGWAEGFYMSAKYFMAAATANASTETIVAHELGHAHSLNDFYNASEVPAGWTHFIMMAGSSNVVTDTDGWMLRDAWRHIRSKWGYPAAQ